MACVYLPKRIPDTVTLKLLVIFNPGASYGRAASRLGDIRDSFHDLGIKAEFLQTGHPGHATDLVAEADLGGYDGLIAAGGDGTVFEVLNGLYRRTATERIPLGLLPVGTGNAFARDLDLQPSAWRDAIELIRRGRTRLVDVGRVEAADASYHFLNIVHMGFTVAANRTALKIKFLGHSAYTLAALWQVLRMESYPLQLEIDGEVVRDDNVFVAVSNTRYTGTHFMMAPAAVVDDGMLDVTLLTRLSRRRVLRLFPTIYDGRHVGFDEVTTRRAEHIRISAPEAMLMAPDGEFRGRTPAEVSCLRRDLELFC
jgi:YegS/Rv2252/BmrU family lipid kinase